MAVWADIGRNEILAFCCHVRRPIKTFRVGINNTHKKKNHDGKIELVSNNYIIYTHQLRQHITARTRA
jgi:hypothetical protein